MWCEIPAISMAGSTNKITGRNLSRISRRRIRGNSNQGPIMISGGSLQAAADVPIIFAKSTFLALSGA